MDSSGTRPPDADGPAPLDDPQREPASDAQPSPIQGIDRLVHEPARLNLLSTLAVLEYADFVYLLNATGLTRGNLSSHMSKLEAAGYVDVEKTFAGRTPRTLLRLTGPGRAALRDYRAQMQRLLEDLPE